MECRRMHTLLNAKPVIVQVVDLALEKDLFWHDRAGRSVSNWTLQSLHTLSIFFPILPSTTCYAPQKRSACNVKLLTLVDFSAGREAGS